MLVEGNTVSGGGLAGQHVPLPTGTRPLPQRPRRTGLDWPAHSTGPDPHAIARLDRLGIVTVTQETVEDKPVRVVRKAKRPKRKPGPRVGATNAGRSRKELDVGDIVRAYEDGASIKGLSLEYGVAAGTIRARLVAEGCEVRTIDSPKVGRNSSDFDEDEALKLARQGWTIRQLEARFGVGRTTVTRRLGRRGHRFVGNRQPPRVDVDRIVTMAESGMSKAAIGRLLGVSDKTVRKHLARALDGEAS